LVNPSSSDTGDRDRAGRPVLLSFSRDNCLPCEIMAPWLDEIGRLYEASIDVVRINLDREASHALGRKWRIRTVPTQVYVTPDGDALYRHEGLATKKDMETILCSHRLVTCR
jgi:thioredoxin 1